MKFKSTMIAVPFMALGTIASAQSVEYLSYGASYQNLSGGGTDIDVFGLGGTIDYRNSDFIINSTINYAEADSSTSVTAFDVRVGYFVTPKAVIYGGYTYQDSDIVGFDFDSFGIGGEYSFNQWTVGLKVDDVDIAGFDTFTSVYAGYQVTNELELGLSVSDQDVLDTEVTVTADYDLGDTELFAVYTDRDLGDFFAINGNYDLNNGFRVGGGYADYENNADQVSISGGYEVAESLWVDVSYANIDFDGGGSADAFGIAISFETGRETLLVDRLETTETEAIGVLGSLVIPPRF